MEVKAPVKAVKPAPKPMAKKEVETKVAAKSAAKEVTIKPVVEVSLKLTVSGKTPEQSQYSIFILSEAKMAPELTEN